MTSPDPTLPAALRRWSRLRRARFPVLAGGALVLLLALAGAQFMEPSEPEPVGGPPMMRRLTEAQYRAIIADIFGPQVPVTGRFEKAVRVGGMIAIGTGSAGISPFAIEQYDASAQGIAAAVMSPSRRNRYLTCGPSDVRRFDQPCATQFLNQNGRLLFRRALTPAETNKYVGLARRATGQLGNFHRGLELSLYTMLIAPDFLFRIEHAKPGLDGRPGELDAYSRASRIAFFLTGSTPDDALLRAAEQGELDRPGGVERQAERLMATPRYEQAVRSFFADMMQFDRFGDLSKDPAIYPAFNSDLAEDAQEQTLRTVVEHLVTKRGDYRDLFTTRDTFLTRSLGVVYRTPVPQRGEWVPATFAPSAHRAGIQSQVAFLSLHSHPGRTSPTLRGYAVRQIFLCQDVPDPPATVNFTAIEASAHRPNVTARDRIFQHATDASCAGCHKVMDPLGLTLENYDGLGTFRQRENGALIDTSGSLDGTDFDTTDGLANALHDHPETPRCVAERMYKAAVGRDITWNERYYLDWLIGRFAADDYRIPDLMRRIVTSAEFFATTRPVMPGTLVRADARTIAGDRL
ncbi:hypothetical protein HNO88_002551 [Novosphingobium chloroacetimidivorans]|uniref:DUF1592 domain-containing protein n=1 Tax=Novosphingobium chloroacetimidivorans TaxID=1428314 RepID=A0A7W7NXK5_9SPHN|nr:DUF1592 domain-containing protein [Novosphingobium chloroacetimidivorans]MBB4859222.1 hypothetical protein [Novosphingobium chloroacetimidivorans]